MKIRDLSAKGCNPAWTIHQRRIYWTWNIGATLLSGLILGWLTLMLSAGAYPLREQLSVYLHRPILLVLNILPVMLLELVLYGLTLRANWAFGITAALIITLGMANYFKLIFRDDTLMFADLLLLREAGAMTKRYPLFLNGLQIAVIGTALVLLLFLSIFVRGRLARRGRMRVSALLLGIAGLICLSPILTSDRIYQNAANDADLAWVGTQWHVNRGFFYSFLHSINTAFEHPPEGYNASEAAALLGQNQDKDIPEDKKVHLICVMLEAYNDFTRFGKPALSQDVYGVWHQLEAEGYSGDLVTNIFAGGTVNTERCFLTGYSSLPSFRGNVNAYPWYFRSQGYRVVGMHPWHQWSYNRFNIQNSLGFEDYAFEENYFSAFPPEDTTSDRALFQAIRHSYRCAIEDGVPYFNFSVSFQGHGPYSSVERVRGEENRPVIDDGNYTEAELCILDNYFASIADTNQQLKVFTDYLRTESEPVVLVLFGDHNPWLGDGNSVYDAMGIHFDTSTQNGFEDYYCTRYLIWANDAAKVVLKNDFQGEGPKMSPCFLMNEVFELCGYEGPAYLQAIHPIAQQVPVIHSATNQFMEYGGGLRASYLPKVNRC